MKLKTNSNYVSIQH